MATAVLPPAPQPRSHSLPKSLPKKSSTPPSNNNSVDPRPKFDTSFRPSDANFVNLRKERQFEEWKKKNYERVKASNIKPKVYQFSRPPRVVPDIAREKAKKASSAGKGSGAAAAGNNSNVNNAKRTSSQPPTSTASSRARKLSPLKFQKKSSSPSSDSPPRRKKLTKTRQREKPAPKLERIHGADGGAGTSSDEGEEDAQASSSGGAGGLTSSDSGVGSDTRGNTTTQRARAAAANRTKSGRPRPPMASRQSRSPATRLPNKSKADSSQQPQQRLSRKPPLPSQQGRKRQVATGVGVGGSQVERRLQARKKKAEFDRATKELVAEVVEHSMCEVKSEERHLGALVDGGEKTSRETVLVA